MSVRNILLKLFTSGVLALVIFGLLTIIRSQKVIAAVGVNKIINFQGKVTNSNGTNVNDGTYDFVIKLYDGAASGSTNTYTESWTAAALWSSTMSVAPTAGQESLTYSSNTNESTIKVGQILWNVTKEEPVVVVGVNTGTNVITISPTRQTWATGDTVTNKVYVKDGTFKVAINSLNQDLSAVNFGTDNIFLGINFNADGEMKPRIQYTATPYAMNADKVNGLTVTNTSDAPFTSATTLKIADGKTVIISNGLTFTGTDSTSFAFPSTGGNVVTEAFTQSLTNKTIGSTGLTFSGATTDITTGTNEDLVITPNGLGKVSIGTATSLGLLTLDGKAAGKALVTLNQATGADQDLFTASQGAATKFTISNTGATSASGMLTFGDGTLANNVLRTAYGSMVLQYKSGGNAWSTGVTLQEGTGNVGIGTTTPLAKLDVGGDLVLGANSSINARSSGTITVGGGANTTGVTLGKSGGTLTLPNFTGNNAVIFSTVTTGVLSAATTSTSGLCLLSGAASTYTPSWTTCPGGGGAPRWDQITNPSAANLSLTMGTNLTTFNWATGTSTNNLFSLTTDASANGTGALLNIQTGASSTVLPLRVRAGSIEALSVKADGNVGIGTSVPGSPLHLVYGDASTNTELQLSRIVRSTSGTAANGIGAYTSTYLEDDSGSFFEAGRFGFIANDVTAGANSYAEFVVRAERGGGLTDMIPVLSAYADGANKYICGNTSVSGDGGPDCFAFIIGSANIAKFSFDGSTRVSWAYGENAGNQVSVRTDNPGDTLNFRTIGAQPIFFQVNDTALTPLYIKSDGNVGISNTNPTQKLDVTGNALIAGNITGVTGLTLASGAINLSGSNGTGSQCLLGGATAAWGSCGGGGGGPTYLDQSNGLTFVGNTTTDFAIGGNSTSSAKFIFGTMSTGTPTATFSGDLIIDNKPSTANVDIQRWTKLTGTAGTVGGGTAGVASISASVVYNGSLYVGTSNSNSAEIYRYDGDALGTWTKVSGTTGTVGGNATTAIDMISSLVVYNGYLYAGTTEADKAEVYRYNGGSSWTQLNAGGVAGTLLSTTLIDGIPSMAVFGGRLFIGTREVTKAQIYMYNGGSTWIAVNGTAGTFVATNSIGMDAITQMVVINNQLVVGTLKGGDSDVLRWNGIVGGSPFFALNLASTTGSYLIDNAAQTGTNEITAMTVWAGKLVIAIRRAANQADILMYQEPPGGAAPINSWTRLNSATGTIGTANIDSVNAMTTYAGRLYVGTTEANGAEIYRFDDSKTWTRVSQNSAGRIAAGGTSSIDSISTLISYNHNSLFAGTQEGTSAEGYSYSVSIDQSYSLKFHAGSSQGGGEQNNNENLGQIFFVASLSANLNNKAGNTGSFVFSHSIVTNNGSYDVAEDYPTRDDTLEPGDIVSIDPNERGFVKKSEGDYDYTAIGVYSEKPALRLSQDETTINGGRAIPVALAGRVPVKVSTENGDIELGDPLTPSSIPGVAMKARKSGLIIGQAMERYSGDSVGKVMTFIKSTSYMGSVAESFLGIDKESSTLGQDILAALETQDRTTGSEVVADRVVAGLEIIAPTVTTKKLLTNNLSIMNGDQLSVDLGENGKVVFKGRGSEGIAFDDKGNAIFTGSIQAKSIKADRIEGLEIITGQMSSLNQIIASLSATLYKSEIITEVASAPAELSSGEQIAALSSIDSIFSSLGVTGVATFSGDVRVKGSGLIEGILSIVDTLTTNQLFVNGLATFFETTVFKKNVQFEGIPIVNRDTAGFALIKKGDKSVDVLFKNEYEELPVINVNLVIDRAEDEKDQEDLDEHAFDEDRDYLVTRRSKKGFTILLKKNAGEDLQFSWTSIMVKDPFLFRSDLVHTLAPPE